MENEGIIIGLITAILLIAVIFIIRTRNEKSESSSAHTMPDSQGVGYQWETKPRVAGYFVLGVIILGGLAVAVLSFVDMDEALELLGKVWFVFVGLLSSLVSGIGKKYLYRITDLGLYKRDLSKKSNQIGKKKENAKDEIVFLWKDLAWFKPGNHGFTWYSKTKNREGFLATGMKTTGYVDAGDNATLINSLIMSRGVPVGPQK